MLVLEAPFVDEDDEEDAEDLLPVEDEVPLDCLLGTSGVVGEADLELDDDEEEEWERPLLLLVCFWSCLDEAEDAEDFWQRYIIAISNSKKILLLLLSNTIMCYTFLNKSL